MRLIARSARSRAHVRSNPTCPRPLSLSLSRFLYTHTQASRAHSLLSLLLSLATLSLSTYSSHSPATLLTQTQQPSARPLFFFFFFSSSSSSTVRPTHSPAATATALYSAISLFPIIPSHQQPRHPQSTTAARFSISFSVHVHRSSLAHLPSFLFSFSFYPSISFLPLSTLSNPVHLSPSLPFSIYTSLSLSSLSPQATTAVSIFSFLSLSNPTSPSPMPTAAGSNQRPLDQLGATADSNNSFNRGCLQRLGVTGGSNNCSTWEHCSCFLSLPVLSL